MLSQALLDERFLSRGPSDELYGDSREEASLWLDDLLGGRSLGGAFDALVDGDDASFDDFAAH
jgi:hypothetical protein